jgi:DNA repair protein RecO (recombination protein O)
MPLVRTPAIILHSFAYGDTSRILRLLTPDFGVRSVIAKGARSPKSRFGGLLEPFTEGEALFNLREGRDLFILTGFSLKRSRQGLGRDLASFTGASLLAEILLRFGTEEAQPAIFDAIVAALDRLTDRPDDPAGSALADLWHLVALLGFQPELHVCVGCGRRLAEDDPTRFDATAGGSVCLDCRPLGRVVAPSVRLAVAAMCDLRRPPDSLHDRRIHADLLHLFLSTYFQGTPLRSLPLFQEQLR